MKKLFVFAGALLLVLSPVAAQEADSVRFRRADGKPVAIETVDRDSLGIDSLRRIDTVDTGLITLRDGGNDGSMVLEVAGFGLTLGQTPMQKMVVKSPRVWLSMLSDMEFGFTQLTGVDYSGYASGETGFLDQQLGPSFHFSFSTVQLCMALNRSRTLSLGIGLQYTLDNIRLADTGITLGRVDGRLVPVALDEPADKSKVVTSSLGIPVRLIYEPVKRLRITAVAYSDFLLGADAIYKKPKKKHSLSGFRSYQFGVGASVTYRGFGLYARYGITPLFNNDAGPGCHTVSFGFAYSLSL